MPVKSTVVISQNFFDLLRNFDFYAPLSRQKKLDKFGYCCRRLLKVIVLKCCRTVTLSVENCCHFNFDFLDPFSNRFRDVFHLFGLALMLPIDYFIINCLKICLQNINQNVIAAASKSLL